MKQALFRKQSHYLWALVLLVAAYVLFMKYVFPPAWADSPQAVAFVREVASLVPAVNNIVISHHASPNSSFGERFVSNFFANMPPYTNYWGMFYATFWVMAPIFWVMGFIGSFFLSEYRYEILIVKNSPTKLFWQTTMACVFSSYEFAVPSTGGYFLDQMSNFLPKLIHSWLVTAAVIYFSGLGLGALFQKVKLSRISKI